MYRIKLILRDVHGLTASPMKLSQPISTSHVSADVEESIADNDGDLFSAINLGPLMEMQTDALESDHPSKMHSPIAASTVALGLASVSSSPPPSRIRSTKMVQKESHSVRSMPPNSSLPSQVSSYESSTVPPLGPSPAPPSVQETAQPARSLKLNADDVAMEEIRRRAKTEPKVAAILAKYETISYWQDGEHFNLKCVTDYLIERAKRKNLNNSYNKTAGGASMDEQANDKVRAYYNVSRYGDLYNK